MKLNQTIAISNGIKTNSEKILTKEYQLLQKDELLSGISRKYNPSKEDGEKLPPEDKKVQHTVDKSIKEISKALKELINIVATQDVANCKAVANVNIKDKIILKYVPVTHLLFLEKQLINLHTYIGKLPILDAGEDWKYDETQGCYRSATRSTARTQKIPEVIVKYQATKEHPAQVEIYPKDVQVGIWENVKYSGCIEKSKRDEYLEKVEELQKAIKIAREEANSIDVSPMEFGEAILNFVFN
jgi:hypothetical protein